jgi:hypothetical protein
MQLDLHIPGIGISLKRTSLILADGRVHNRPQDSRSPTPFPYENGYTFPESPAAPIIEVAGCRTVVVDVTMPDRTAFYIDMSTMLGQGEFAIVLHVQGMSPLTAQVTTQARSTSPLNYYYMPDQPGSRIYGWQSHTDYVSQFVVVKPDSRLGVVTNLRPDLANIVPATIGVAVYAPAHQGQAKAPVSMRGPDSSRISARQEDRADVGAAGFIWDSHIMDPHIYDPSYWNPNPRYIGIWNLKIGDLPQVDLFADAPRVS